MRCVFLKSAERLKRTRPWFSCSLSDPRFSECPAWHSGRRGGLHRAVPHRIRPIGGSTCPPANHMHPNLIFNPPIMNLYFTPRSPWRLPPHWTTLNAAIPNRFSTHTSNILNKFRLIFEESLHQIYLYLYRLFLRFFNYGACYCFFSKINIHRSTTPHRNCVNRAPIVVPPLPRSRCWTTGLRAFGGEWKPAVTAARNASGSLVIFLTSRSFFKYREHFLRRFTNRFQDIFFRVMSALHFFGSSVYCPIKLHFFSKVASFKRICGQIILGWNTWGQIGEKNGFKLPPPDGLKCLPRFSVNLYSRAMSFFFDWALR